MHLLKSGIVYLLTLEARLILWRHTPRVIAVTGSVGKTGTKDALYTALHDGSGMVRKNEKSLNSEFGVPLTIIGAESGWHNPLAWLFILIKGLLACIRPTYPHTLIVEVGADHPGDIARIASWLSPHAAVITAVPDIPAHAGYYESPEDVLKEKRELFVHADKDAPLFVNGDDARTLSLKKDFRARTTTFGFDPACDIRAAHYEVMYDKRTPVGIRFRLESEGVSIPVMLYGVVGKTHVYPVLIACAVAHAYGLDYATAAQRFTDYEPAPGRMRLIEGVNGSTIIDDSYNASPGAMHAALDTLADIEGSGRTIALLGDMRELGTHSARAHREVGEHAAQVASLLITVGEESLVLAQGAIDAGLNPDRVTSFGYGEADKAGALVAHEVREGDVVLVKGSQNKIRLERAVKKLMAHPENAPALLVRQEGAWEEIA
jgi:UDP-N-acetylmuramoyl-tripeptide--D-alanyl-D-alanine ligase